MRIKIKTNIYQEMLQDYFNDYDINLKIKESILYSFMSEGKFIRSKLFNNFLLDLGLDPKHYLNMAMAIEMIHTYSLIHDDLPCMDDDDYRRSKLTNHKVYGEDIALLSGDALLTHAFEYLVLDIKDKHVKDVILFTTQAIGINGGMINGQVLDILQVNDIEKIHIQKTASLLSLSFILPLIISENKDKINYYKDYAYKLGLYYQIQDDYFDTYGSIEQIGKASNSDQDKYTYTKMYSKQDLESLLKEMNKSLLDSIKEQQNTIKVIKKIVNRER
ncbi:MAG: polyprenyl synthetase family protein [Mycoplasmatales bacterium]